MHILISSKFTSLSFEKACCIARQSIGIQQASWKPCLVNLISKDTQLVFSIYLGESDTELRLNCLRLVQSLILDDGNFGVVHEVKEVVSGIVYVMF